MPDGFEHLPLIGPLRLPDPDSDTVFQYRNCRTVEGWSPGGWSHGGISKLVGQLECGRRWPGLARRTASEPRKVAELERSSDLRTFQVLSSQRPSSALHLKILTIQTVTSNPVTSWFFNSQQQQRIVPRFVTVCYLRTNGGRWHCAVDPPMLGCTL